MYLQSLLLNVVRSAVNRLYRSGDKLLKKRHFYEKCVELSTAIPTISRSMLPSPTGSNAI